MAALIMGCLHINVAELKGTEQEKEAEFIRLWSQTKFFMSIAYQVKFE